MMLVKFQGVGRGKKSWEKKMYPDLDDIAHEARRALASRDVWAVFDEDSLKSGCIYAGLHRVGAFEITQVLEG